MARREISGLDSFEISHHQLLARCAGYLPVAPSGFAFSHITAARIYGMPLPDRIGQRIELDVGVTSTTQPPRRSGVIGHRIRVGEIRAIGGLPVVAPETAWMQLAGQLTVDELIEAGDFLVRRKRPLSTAAALRATVAMSAKHRGSVAARAALGGIRSGTDSPMESRLRLAIVRGGLPEPRIGFTVCDENGDFVGTPDLAYVAQRIAIEYEGDGHRIERAVYHEDIERRELFELAGWRVFRVTFEHLKHPQLMVHRLTRLLRERANLR